MRVSRMHKLCREYLNHELDRDCCGVRCSERIHYLSFEEWIIFSSTALVIDRPMPRCVRTLRNLERHSAKEFRLVLFHQCLRIDTYNCCMSNATQKLRD
jgi:hypothetical protein